MRKKKNKKRGATASGAPAEKASFAQTVGAIIAGLLAVKLATYVVTTVWRLITRENPPQVDEAVPPLKKAAWIGLIGAATGAARQAARDLVKPPTGGPA
jgi:hypothetical protein